MSTSRTMSGWLWALVMALGLVAAHDAEARPTYFQVFTDRYGIVSGDRLYACGNCHIKWTGTGARNPFGNAVEQQLYIGKSISQALADLEPMDTDGDGYSNVDEIVTFQTLAAYSCNDFFLSQGAPIGYDTYITPNVPSCLEPLDIRVEPGSVSFITKAGTTNTLQVQIINNGSTDPLHVSSYQLLPGAHPTLSVTGPTAPFDIQVGGIVELDVSFAPNTAVIGSATLRISSDDPDEGTVDLPVQGFGFVQTLGAPEVRARCLKSVDSQFRRYADRHRREWNRCFLDEIKGQACDEGARDLKIQQAETHFRAAVGGAKDKTCVGANMTAPLLGFPATCGGTCSITLNTMASVASCLVCRENEARDDMLRDGLGTAPPDSPPNVAGTSAANRCEKQIASRLAKGISSVQKVLGRCELANVTADTPVDCSATNAAAIADVQAQVNEAANRCTDSTGLLGCLFEGGLPTCLGDSAGTIGSTLVGATFPQP
ncbi:MAG: hypothetical protein ABIR79_17380 [Candidatus Binatia bacterium]